MDAAGPSSGGGASGPEASGGGGMCLRISSPCNGSCVRLAEPAPEGAGWADATEDDLWGRRGCSVQARARGGAPSWHGFCSCCKRPLTITWAEPSPQPRKRPREAACDKFAYVVALWGSNEEYVLGAMVLGHSLRRSETRHDLVAMVTSDVPEGALGLLRRSGWAVHTVEYVEASERLYHKACLQMRFADVFTKLRVLELTQYSKVVLLDADLLVTANIDDLFDLAAPAAMARGPRSGYAHGAQIDCRDFFAGAKEDSWSWGQAWGINAGVMLLEPSREVLEQCLSEVRDPLHPEHVRGNGPEQDYLSRFFAGNWRHIDAAYNFQLHQMYFALSPTCSGSERLRFFQRPEDIKVVHYSSERKPWARHLDAQSYGAMPDEQWLKEIKRTFKGYRAWVERDEWALSSEAERSSQVAMGPDGRLHRVVYSEEEAVAGVAAPIGAAGPPGGAAPRSGEAAQGDGSQRGGASAGAEREEGPAGASAVDRMYSASGDLLGEVAEPPEEAIQAAEGITARSVELWDSAYRELAAELGERDLARAVREATSRHVDDMACDDAAKTCAFVVALWGASVEYVLGAMVLGHSLVASGTTHDLVAMVTDDVPKGALEFLKKSGWKLHRVEYVDAAEQLFAEHCLKMRFADVFTKLRVLELEQYSKVVLLDADLLVQCNIDDLFDLPAPAAMARGPWSGYAHGDRIDGRFFFTGQRDGVKSWGQTSGINAGVMLLKPDLEKLRHQLAEVRDPLHPEHVRGAGPEQDYLSRFYAGEWRHIDVAYNFQLHQMYFALNPLCGGDRERFLHTPGAIKVLHYSAEPKPWARHLDKEKYGRFTEEDWCTEIKSQFSGFTAWVQRDAAALGYEAGASSGRLAVGPDGKLRRVLWEDSSEAKLGEAAAGEDAPAGAPLEAGAAEAGRGTGCLRSEDGLPLGEVVEASQEAIDGAEEITRMAMRSWDSAYRALAQKLCVEDLAGAVRAAVSAPREEDAVASAARSEEDSAQESWTQVDGWWIERPCTSRAVSTCGLMPEPFAVLKFGDAVLLSARTPGLHLAAVGGASGALPAPASLTGEGLAELASGWAQRVAAGATVLLAVVGLSAADTREALAALAGAGLGCPAGPPPAGYPVLAAVGAKGGGAWHSTHGAAEVALATSLVR